MLDANAFAHVGSVIRESDGAELALCWNKSDDLFYVCESVPADGVVAGREFGEHATCYEHYKGNRYDYLGMAIQHADSAIMAIYRSTDTGTRYARPHEEFFGDVLVDGQEIRRFKLIRKGEPHETGNTGHSTGEA